MNPNWMKTFFKSLYQERQHLDKINKELYKRNLELAVKNKTLLLLRKLYEVATSTVFLEELANNFSFVLRKSLNLPLVEIYLYKKEKNILQLIGRSNSEKFEKASSRVNLNVENFFFDLNKKISHLVPLESFNKIKIRKTSFLKKIFPSIIEAEKLEEIQKISGIKSILIYPLILENKRLGITILSFNRNFSELSKFEQESFQSFVNIITIALDKALLYNKLTEANEHLKELDNAKSEFISIASHQLRTPLTGIMGYLSMMVDGDFGKIDPGQMKVIKDVLGASNRLIRIVNIFLNVSRIEAGRFYLDYKKVPFKSVVGEIVMELKPTATKKGIELEIDDSVGQVGDVVVDPDKLKDVVLNLIDNAIKYSQQGTIRVKAKKEDDHVHAFIQDQGVGIDPQEAERLFSKFVRGSGIARVQPNGSGLGLFIAKKIVEEHGGKIWVESEGEGKGSTFQFLMPLKPTKQQIDLQQKIASRVSKQKAQAAQTTKAG